MHLYEKKKQLYKSFSQPRTFSSFFEKDKDFISTIKTCSQKSGLIRLPRLGRHAEANNVDTTVPAGQASVLEVWYQMLKEVH